MTTTFTSSLKSLCVGDLFSLTPEGTIYRVTRPVKSGAGQTVVTYVVVGDLREFEFYRASLTTVYLHNV